MNSGNKSVRTEMPFWFNIFLFSFLSPFSSLYSFLFSLRHSLSLPSQSSLLKISLIFAQDLSPPHLAVNLHSPRHRPLDLLIGPWVWDLRWVSMCEFWVIDWSVGLGFWAAGGVMVVAVVGWVLGWGCLWLKWAAVFVVVVGR